MFTHFIFVVEGSLTEFDPIYDKLIDPLAYLTWRRVDQDTPSGSCKLYGAVYHTYEEKGQSSWNLVRFDLRRSFEGTERWINSISRQFPKIRLGRYERTKFTGMLAPIGPTFIPSPFQAFQRRIELLDELVTRGVIPNVPSFDREPIGVGAEWDEVRRNVIDQLLYATIEA